jgi:valine--pyruvate aminotransferase
MNLSSFGRQFVQDCGILQLMDDLGHAVAGDASIRMLGGGNPSHIPAVEACFRERMASILADGDAFERLIGNYAPPQGDKAFTAAVAGLLRREYGWPITAANIALTNGSQTAFFYLFNLLAGPFPDGTRKKILLPLAPEYIGYTDVGLSDDLFVAYRPEIEHLDERLFKYRVDFGALRVTDDIGAICVSRPTNPTGNVLTDDEISHLRALARARSIPLIIDNAYGLPFPSITYAPATPVWDEDIVLCLSLSKLGLPGLRTGIIVASEEVVRAISSLNAILSLAPGNAGAYMALDLVQSGDIIRLSETIIRPHYQARAEQAVAWVREALGPTPGYIHKPEGAFFLWLWFEGLPISSAELYERLKQCGVLIVPGHYFFPGLQEPWAQKTECIRMNYAQDEQTVREGIAIIADEVRRAYAARPPERVRRS